MKAQNREPLVEGGPDVTGEIEVAGTDPEYHKLHEITRQPSEKTRTSHIKCVYSPGIERCDQDRDHYDPKAVSEKLT
ncbi:hypothetical protein [Thermogutta terrifontis]|uniref:hypothetical protein n=1 Tax=Thermogutta terrifontis TaxID=1331910 RepID=UPI001F46D6F2|nr:hypothetical protein [Thermogutta terrifontis]